MIFLRLNVLTVCNDAPIFSVFSLIQGFSDMSNAFFGKGDVKFSVAISA